MRTGEDRHRVIYANLKTGRFQDINCIDKVYETIKKMESKGEVQIFFDERDKQNEMAVIV